MSLKKISSVLIVDDNIKNLQVLADILRNKNYKVAMAKDGVKALKFIEKIKPDVVLLDIMMPEIDGFEVCRQLKSKTETKDIPVIFISALTSMVNKVKAFESGGVDYVTKPFQKEEILARVKTHLELKHSQEELKIAYQKLQKAYEELELASRTDTLTKLSNRRDIIEKIKYEKIRFERNGKTFSLILCDIDNFKMFNDKYGHDCGDFVLVSAAQLMCSIVRKQDCVARWGGEEFLLLLPETNLQGSKIVAEKIRQKLSDSYYEYNHQRIKISMTFGISLFSSQYDNIEQCIKNADEAMYKGKRTGKNCIVLYEVSENCENEAE